MKLFYEADIKVKIEMDSKDEEVKSENIPTQEMIDDALEEALTNELDAVDYCEIKINSKFKLE